MWRSIWLSALAGCCHGYVPLQNITACDAPVHNGHVIGLALFIRHTSEHYCCWRGRVARLVCWDRRVPSPAILPEPLTCSHQHIFNNMSTNIAPWLQGLDDGWTAPTHAVTSHSISSASHDADSLRHSTSRIPRRSLSGLPSSISTKRTDSTQQRRLPLAQLNSNDTNTLQRGASSVRMSGMRSFSEASDGSGLACGTVQQRSKSASPSKKQETMEWKKRLVRGNVGYGDQTDLFGATGLENIFARTGMENEAPKPKNRMGWLPMSDAPMPSSPPPWPSSLGERQYGSDIQPHSSNEGHVGDESSAEFSSDNSVRSNPFDLQNTDDIQSSDVSEALQQQDRVSSQNEEQDDAHATSANRTVSGQTDLEQEDFSPVYISKTKTLNGFDYAALDSHLVKQFNSTKVNLRHPSQDQLHGHETNSDGPGVEIAEQSTFTDGPESESLPTMPDISFSENLPTGSPFPNLGKNVEVKRGGYSNFGSFKQRPLSPSQSTAGASLNPAASGLLSPVPSDERPSPGRQSPPDAPTTPRQGAEAHSRSSGSPLKLFGPHDTFTSNRLLRRMSQLNPDGTLKLNTVAESSPRTLQRDPSRVVSSASSFGRGELDHHTFDAEITITSASDSSKDDSDQSPGSEVPVPGSKIPSGFRFDEPAPEMNTFGMKRKLSKHSVATSRGSTLETQRRASNEQIAPATDSKIYAEGKRPPTSPFKNPTPKRRRTLHASELEDGIANLNFNYHSQLQEAVGSRKRRDARPGDDQIQADPDVLAQRKILRPRNPTPSQRRRQQIEVELREAAEQFAEQEPEKLEAVMEHIESSMASDEPQTLAQQAQTLASEVAAFTLNVQKPSGEHEGERKRSVTTQDFLDEAMMVMNLIRAKARPQSNLGSVEESDAEAYGQSTRPEDSDEEQSHLRVSRPPSREGSGWRTRNNPQTNARVISHLRKFEERDERDDTGFIANSIVSLQADDDDYLNDQVVFVDENSNIRITGPSHEHERQAQEMDSGTDSHRSDGSATTTHTVDNSTGRTIGTSSTRKSDNVGTLAPDAVAHLIGEQVGGMTFDKEKQRWVRVQKSPPKQTGSFLELPSNVTSDDDPLREISDLPVDEQKELRRISSPAKLAEAEALADGKSSMHDQALRESNHQPTVESRTSSNETVIPRPVTRDSSHIHHMHSSSVPSRYTAFGSSQQEKVETRATSWSDEELARLSAIGKAKQHLAQQMGSLSPVNEPSAEDAGQGGNITFPSPPNQHLPTGVADYYVDSEFEAQNEDLDKLTGLRDDTALDLAQSEVQDIDSPKLRQTPSRVSFPPSSVYRGAARQMSLRRQTLTNRFATEAHESSELSLVAPLPGDRMMSLSLSVSRPVSTRQQPRTTDLQSSPTKGGASFLWSDLPDFTVHEEDAERPSEKILAKRLAHHAAAEVSDRYALAVKDLVKTLTDVNEDEPYWEDLKQLSLQGRSLASLYGLDDFCTRIEDMDVSTNALTQLNGAPSTTRRLNARSNRLSSLTSWNHLANLQILDVSSNQLGNLDGLGSLIHLRELRADDNEITQLDGILLLDGLMKLRLRRNKLQQVDFKDRGLRSLTHLDLSGNRHVSLDHVDNLASLTELKLDGCQLRDALPVDHWMPQLTSLSLRDCGLTRLDVSRMPNLQRLVVDDNQLTSIGGLNKLNRLQTLSMRRQTLPTNQSISIFDQAFEATSVFLSGNALSTLSLSSSFLSIRHLELASAGLQDLPDDFGLKMPNLRTLNLNFNSLKDVRPLLNIQKLQTLSLSGNRISRLRKSVATLGKLTTLRELDLRDTPLTMGLYASFASTLSRQTALVPKVLPSGSEDEDEQDAHLERARYEVPSADRAQDAQHQARMDEDSKLRRRVYELLLANSCSSLRLLDGLAFDTSTPLVKDHVWRRLVELGVVRKSRSGVAEHADEGRV